MGSAHSWGAERHAVETDDAFGYPQRIAYLFGCYSDACFVHSQAGVAHAAEQCVHFQCKPYLRIGRVVFSGLQLEAGGEFSAKEVERIR